MLRLINQGPAGPEHSQLAVHEDCGGQLKFKVQEAGATTSWGAEVRKNVNLDREQVRELRDQLTEWLGDGGETAPLKFEGSLVGEGV